MSLAPYQMRVIDEYRKVAEQLENLRKFLVQFEVKTPESDDAITKEEVNRLRKQASIMTDYVMILRERIINFTPVSSTRK